MFTSCKYAASSACTKFNSDKLNAVSVIVCSANISEYCIGFAPKPLLVRVLLRAMKYSHTCLVSIGISQSSSASALCPVRRSIASRCPLAVVPSLRARSSLKLAFAADMSLSATP